MNQCTCTEANAASCPSCVALNESLKSRVSRRTVPAGVVLAGLAGRPLAHGIPFLRAGFSHGLVLFDFSQLDIGDLWWADLTDHPNEQIDVKRVAPNIVKVNGEFLFVNPIAAQPPLTLSRPDSPAPPPELDEASLLASLELPELPQWKDHGSEGSLSLPMDEEAVEEDMSVLLRRYDERIRQREKTSRDTRQQRLAAMMRRYLPEPGHSRPTDRKDEELAEEDDEEDPFRQQLRSRLSEQKLEERQRKLEAQQKELLSKYGVGGVGIG
mmetsp:Transcript_44302/g.111608  ORF Transcript_44302/g.111608 Transcript_44302/m.111608 type:complete len:269 (-) Transcript_44302:114-920(-)|eukprot:CAMPEP_0174242572 /NCGR_PEP_ID=MMETSP0417-20130205/28405_1 /TAXON_ID=242541 /ORGANISM="Mayorella sp, Strain BSH-02190019" /LENGTH=268 /DNA_ID=CAMNT_0015321987 /DNA_START=117 /DNA_END=923 /DNA_ORIENTATION=-